MEPVRRRDRERGGRKTLGKCTALEARQAGQLLVRAGPSQMRLEEIWGTFLGKE